MDLRIAGRSAVITGGSQGIGRAVAAELAREGVRVVIAARNAERLATAARELTAETGGQVTGIVADIAVPEQIDAMLAAARGVLGPIDILVNNAGSAVAGRIDQLTDEQWRSAFDLKLLGYMRCARAVLPAMRAQRWGRIVNIAGRGGEIATPGYLLGSFNAAVLYFSRALALDAAVDNVLVNAVNPGAVETPRWYGIIAQKAKATGRDPKDIENEWRASVLVGRAAAPEDVADLVTFLCSERARHIAGSSFNIDGGGAAGV